MEKYLHDRLDKFNNKIPNIYRENWGSALQYLESSIIINQIALGEEQIFNQID